MAHIRDDLSTGRRIYVQTKFGEPVVEKLKDAGCKWDAAAKCWWAGAAKRAAIEAVLVQRDKDEDEGVDMTPKKQTPDDIRLTGKGKYKGREYYAGSITKDGTKVRLLTLPDAEGKYLDFWAHCSEVQQTKTYSPREVWDGRRYSGQTRTVYTTLGSIADFITEQKADRAAGLPMCAECGKSGELIQDLEDGLMKHERCCDIPS